MKLCLTDLTSLVYLSTLLTAIYGFGLFFWWWVKKGAASSVFAYVTFIFFGEIIESSMSLLARIWWLTHGLTSHIALMNSIYWPMRKIVTMAALAFIVIHMSWRAFRNLPIGESRRETD